MPLSFPRLVQPVLDAKCVACHAGDPGKKAPDLSGRRYKSYTVAYENLGPYAWCLSMKGEYMNRPENLARRTSPVRSIPGEVGSTESLLHPMLTTGSHKDRVQLTPEEMERITTWLDCFSVFFSSYDDPDAQKDGKLVWPALE